MAITRLILNRLISFLNFYNVIITGKRRMLERHSIALGIALFEGGGSVINALSISFLLGLA